MAQEIEILKDITGPNGKPWQTGLQIVVDTPTAQKLIAEGSARSAKDREKEMTAALAKLVAKGKVTSKKNSHK